MSANRMVESFLFDMSPEEVSDMSLNAQDSQAFVMVKVVASELHLGLKGARDQWNNSSATELINLDQTIYVLNCLVRL
jgi:hypothetical protein